MRRWSPIVLAKKIHSLRHVRDTHVAIDDRLQQREFFETGINSAGTIGAQQDRVLNQQARVFDRRGGRVTNEALAFGKVPPRETGDFAEVLSLFEARKLECLFEDRKVFHAGGLLGMVPGRLLPEYICESVTNSSLKCAR